MLGDATKEFGPFYSITYNYGTTKPGRYISSYFNTGSYFMSSEEPWLIRGGNFYFGSESNIGAFHGAYDHGASEYSFRTVLTP